MKSLWSTTFGLLIIIGLLLSSGCDNDDTPSSSGPTWQTVFEDHFEGDTLNTTNWTQFESSPPPYSLTGSGELEIEGDPGDLDGATFIYNTAISGNYVKLITKFRTTQNDPIQDDVDIAVVLNGDITTGNSYVLMLTSDPYGSTRDYRLFIFKYINGAETVLTDESMGGTMPQISAGNDYILEGVNSNGTIIFTIKDGSGNELKSISIEDSSHYLGGNVGFLADLNIGSTGSQSIFFDYVRVQKYQ